MLGTGNEFNYLFLRKIKIILPSFNSKQKFVILLIREMSKIVCFTEKDLHMFYSSSTIVIFYYYQINSTGKIMYNSVTRNIIPLEIKCKLYVYCKKIIKEFYRDAENLYAC